MDTDPQITMSEESRAMVLASREVMTLDQAVIAWVTKKFSNSGSKKTRRAYV